MNEVFMYKNSVRMKGMEVRYEGKEKNPKLDEAAIRQNIHGNYV
jgi:hypothetical protein